MYINTYVLFICVFINKIGLWYLVLLIYIYIVKFCASHMNYDYSMLHLDFLDEFKHTKRYTKISKIIIFVMIFIHILNSDSNFFFFFDYSDTGR